MSKSPSVKDIMQEARFSVAPDTPVYEALDLLIKKKLSGIPVLDDDKLVGFLTEKDCLRLQATAHQYNMTGRTVKDIMSSINITAKPETDLLTAAQLFLQCNFSALPVLQGDMLVGSLTRRDVVHGIQKWNQSRGQDFAQEKQAQRMVDNPNSIENMQRMVGGSMSREQIASVFRGRKS